MTRALCIALATACCCLAAGLWSVRDERDAAIREQGALAAANASQKVAIAALRAGRAIDNAVVLQAATEQDTLKTKMADLEGRLQEALRNASHLTLDSLLPRAAADALCLQWHEAGGIGAGDTGNAAGSADARTADTTAPDCRRFRRMTLRHAVEWNSLLLRHAGDERLDKAGLRDWAARVQAREGAL